MTKSALTTRAPALFRVSYWSANLSDRVKQTDVKNPCIHQKICPEMKNAYTAGDEDYEHSSERELNEDEDNESVVNYHQRVIQWLREMDSPTQPTQLSGIKKGCMFRPLNQLNASFNTIKYRVKFSFNLNCFPSVVGKDAMENSQDASRPSTINDFLNSQTSTF